MPRARSARLLAVAVLVAASCGQASEGDRLARAELEILTARVEEIEKQLPEFLRKPSAKEAEAFRRSLGKAGDGIADARAALEDSKQKIAEFKVEMDRLAKSAARKEEPKPAKVEDPDLAVEEVTYEVLSEGPYWRVSWSVRVRNHSSERATFAIQVNFLDAGGSTVEDGYDWWFELAPLGVGTFSDVTSMPEIVGLTVRSATATVRLKGQ